MKFKEFLWKCIVFAIVLYTMFFILRAGFILYLGVWKNELGQGIGSWEYIKTFFYGWCYDGQIVGILTLLFFLITIIFHKISIGQKISNIFILLVISISCFLSITQISFYQIHNDIFNANIFNLNEREIFLFSFWQHNTALKLFIWLISCIIFLSLIRIGFKIVEIPHKSHSYKIQHIKTSKQYTNLIILFIAFVCWEVLAISGIKNKLRTSIHQTFLQQASTNIWQNLYATYKNYIHISHLSFYDYIKQPPHQVVEEFFHITPNPSINTYDLAVLLQKNVNNPSNIKIEYIFYIVIDGMSEWHFNKEFDEISLSSGLKDLINTYGAFKADIFLQNAPTNIKSFDSQISGLLNIDIPFRLLSEQLPIFKTALAINFKQLGYKNYLYYAGSINQWQKFDEFVHSQGFDESFYNTHIVQNAKIKAYQEPYENAQGVYEHHLFNFVRDKFFINQKKSFNLILTTSNQISSDILQKNLNVPMEHIESFLKQNPEIAKNTSKQALGYIYYQDKTIKKFINDISNRFPNTLFIITGSHYDGGYASSNTLKIQNSVPLIIYAPTLKPFVVSNIGSHIDIMPTILELVAPNGYKYASFGTTLLSNKQSIYQVDTYQAFGYNTIATYRFIYDGYSLEYFAQGLERDRDEELAHTLLKRLQQAKALSWWVFKNGYIVPKE